MGPDSRRDLREATRLSETRMQPLRLPPALFAPPFPGPAMLQLRSTNQRLVCYTYLLEKALGGRGFSFYSPLHLRAQKIVQHRTDAQEIFLNKLMSLSSFPVN